MDIQEEIKRVAYELYEKSGRISGRELENWLAAEKIVMTRHAKQDEPTKARQSTRTRAAKTPSAVSKARKAEVPGPAPRDAGSRKPRAKKTVVKKAAKPGD